MFSRWRAILALVVACAICCIGMLGCSENWPDGAAAKVGNTYIMEDEVVEYTSDFQKDNGITDNATWAEYLESEGLNATTWRENVISQLATRQIAQDKAAELGIEADESVVEERLQNLKDTYASNDGDGSKWQEYLDRHETTEDELRQEFAYSSILQQLLQQEVVPDVENDDDLTNSYVVGSMGDRVFHKYSAITFAKGDREKAQQVLDGLLKLSGKTLESAFYEDAKKYSVNQGDDKFNIGWDVMMDMTLAKNAEELNSALLEASQLFGKLLETDNSYQILYCTETLTIESDFNVADLDDESLKEFFRSGSLSANYASESQSYLKELLDAQEVMVSSTPSGISYDMIL